MVNNWFVFMDGVVAATSDWSLIFFYFWYFIAALILVNSLVAFILNAFLAEWEKRKQEKLQFAARAHELRCRRRKLMEQRKLTFASLSSPKERKDFLKQAAREDEHLEKEEQNLIEVHKEERKLRYDDHVIAALVSRVKLSISFMLC